MYMYSITKHILIGIVLLSLHFHGGIAQDIPYANIHAHRFNLNPASIGMANKLTIATSYLNKWSGMKAAFNTCVLRGIIPLPSYASTFSIDLLHDEQGNKAITNNSAFIKYAYNLTLYENLSLLMGITSSFSVYKLNPEQFIFESDILGETTSEIIDKESNSYFDFNVGAILRYNETYYGGISVAHITQPEISPGYSISPTLALVAGTEYHLGSMYNLNAPIMEPVLFYRIQNKNQNIAIGSSFQIRSFYTALHINFFIHKSYGGIHTSHFSAGYSSPSYNICYTYSVHIAGYNNFNYNLSGHEVTFSYQLKYKRKNIQ